MRERLAIAESIARRALPCPFCGERLVVREDHHGQWVAHRNEPADCFDGAAQLHKERDLIEWNKRVQPSCDDPQPTLDSILAAVRRAADNFAWNGDTRMWMTMNNAAREIVEFKREMFTAKSGRKELTND